MPRRDDLPDQDLPDEFPSVSGHPATDDLAVLALGDHVETEDLYDHVLECARCQQVVSEFEHAMQWVTATATPGPTPGPAVWSAVLGELGDDLTTSSRQAEAPTEYLGRGGLVVAGATESGSGDHVFRGEPGTLGEFPPVAAAPETDHGAPAGDELAAVRTRRRRWATSLVAAAVVGALVGGGIVFATRDREPDLQVQARADLTPVAGGIITDTDRTFGSAQLIDAGGREELRVRTDDLPQIDGTYEVWLLGQEGRMVSLGVLHDGHGTFTVPGGTDLGEYRLVDISDEPLDGNPVHSGNSVVRGDLQ
ncbi:anti-sigma factor [Nakamurella leprariae]|uniref:Anti-sigma factor n=1 Tax=Nakamurella leprariae TaxID=2803911 RepID=A0A939BY85_9ACTN|nr:anti-sigma factor [Nakamurella leprariae]MBM9466346.1 anti-sigma factor [Nakamurella leprariae]